MIVCTEIKQKQPQDRKTVFETLSLPVARSCRLSRDRRQLRFGCPKFGSSGPAQLGKKQWPKIWPSRQLLLKQVQVQPAPRFGMLFLLHQARFLARKMSQQSTKKMSSRQPTQKMSRQQPTQKMNSQQH